MRRVLKGMDEAAHYWANQVQPEGKAGNVFFENGKIYSYGYHFCIARHLKPGVIAFTTRDYSNSTSKHKGTVRHAARHLTFVYCYNPAASARENKEDAEKSIRAALLHAEKPRIRDTTRHDARALAVSLTERFNAYLAALPGDEARGIAPLDTTGFDAMRAELAAEAAAISARQLERNKEAKAAKAAREREAQLKAEEKLDHWRAHVAGSSAYNLRALPVALRLSSAQENVETSHGARIPVADARELWPFVVSVRNKGKALPIIGTGRPLGVYHLNEIRADGSIVVGCHDIPFAELHGIAKQLKLDCSNVREVQP